MMTQVLQNKVHALLDEVLLGFLASVCPPGEGPFVKFNYVKFMLDVMQQQFVDFKALRTFRHQSYL